MRTILRRDKSPLVLLLATLAMTSWGCTTGGKPSAAIDTDMEPSQNEELANSDNTDNSDKSDDKQDADDNLQNLSNNDSAGQNLNFANNNEKDKEKSVEMPKTPAVPETVPGDTGYLAGKAGDPMELGLPEAGSKMAYIVQKGDTLSKIAKKVFSDQERWRELAEASALKNPNRIFPGDVIYYQLDKTTVAFARTYEKMERKETTVEEGETLSDVSRRIYGDQMEWKLLWRHNDRIMDPNKLEVGSVVYYVKFNTMANASRVSKNHSLIKKPVHSKEFSDRFKMTRQSKKVKA